MVKHSLHVCLGVRPRRVRGVPQLPGHELALGPADVEAEAEFFLSSPVSRAVNG